MDVRKLPDYMHVFESIGLMSLAFMWLMPFGSFDPLQIGFYLSIFLSVTIHFSITWYLRTYQEPRPYNKKSPILEIARQTESIAFNAIVLMWIMPYGSFNPSEVGFYLSIVLAVWIHFSIKFFLKKYQSKQA